MPRYLADTSIWSWANKADRRDIRQKLSRRVAADEVVTCVPVALEVMHRPDTSGKYERQYTDLLEPLDWLPLTDAAGERAMEVQRLLATQSDGAHRRPAIDFLIAAVAELRDDVVLWAFDDDYAVIAGATGQAVEIETSTAPSH